VASSESHIDIGRGAETYWFRIAGLDIHLSFIDKDHSGTPYSRLSITNQLC